MIRSNALSDMWPTMMSADRATGLSCGKITCRYSCHSVAPSIARGLAQLLGDAAEAGQEQRHHVARQLPDRRGSRSRRCPTSTLFHQLFCRNVEPDHLEQPVEAGRRSRPGWS